MDRTTSAPLFVLVSVGLACLNCAGSSSDDDDGLAPSGGSSTSSSSSGEGGGATELVHSPAITTDGAVSHGSAGGAVADAGGTDGNFESAGRGDAEADAAVGGERDAVGEPDVARGSDAASEADAAGESSTAGESGADAYEGSVAGDESDGGGQEDASPDEDGSSAAPDELYASPTGSGTDCSLSAPCSLTGARDKVRTLNGAMSKDLTVYLRGGSYELTEPFALVDSAAGPHDSGSNGYKIVYQAYPGEQPHLSGGRTLTGFTLVDAAKNIYQTSAPGISTRHLFVNGGRAQRARGAINPPGFAEYGPGYATPDASMDSWGNKGDVEVVSFSNWKMYRCGVADIENGFMTMKQPCWSNGHYHAVMPIRNPTWIENAYELLDEEGEFYLDRSSGSIYYKPRAGEDMSTATVVAPVLEQLITF
jgi:hypothetical protein